jgi:hypothetical protein
MEAPMSGSAAGSSKPYAGLDDESTTLQAGLDEESTTLQQQAKKNAMRQFLELELRKQQLELREEELRSERVAKELPPYSASMNTTPLMPDILKSSSDHSSDIFSSKAIPKRLSNAEKHNLSRPLKPSADFNNIEQNKDSFAPYNQTVPTSCHEYEDFGQRKHIPRNGPGDDGYGVEYGLNHKMPSQSMLYKQQNNTFNPNRNSLNDADYYEGDDATCFERDDYPNDDLPTDINEKIPPTSSTKFYQKYYGQDKNEHKYDNLHGQAGHGQKNNLEDSSFPEIDPSIGASIYSYPADDDIREAQKKKPLMKNNPEVTDTSIYTYRYDDDMIGTQKKKPLMKNITEDTDTSIYTYR